MENESMGFINTIDLKMLDSKITSFDNYMNKRRQFLEKKSYVKQFISYLSHNFLGKMKKEVVFLHYRTEIGSHYKMYSRRLLFQEIFYQTNFLFLQFFQNVI